VTYENVRYHLTTLQEVSLLTNFGGVQTPRPQINPKFLGSWRTAALGGLLQRGGMFLVCLKRHDFISWLGRRRNITRYFCMSHSSRSMTLRAASSIESLQTTNDRPTIIQRIYRAFCDSSSKTTTALPFSSEHDVSITPKG
jgi:hypothetical protein